MDYPSAKFGDFSFSHFGFIVRTDRQNHRGGSTLYSRDYDVSNDRFLLCIVFYFYFFT